MVGKMVERYVYGGPYKTADRATMALESMYAEAEVSPGEKPTIERQGKGYVITLAGWEGF